MLFVSHAFLLCSLFLIQNENAEASFKKFEDFKGYVNKKLLMKLIDAIHDNDGGRTNTGVGDSGILPQPDEMDIIKHIQKNYDYRVMANEDLTESRVHIIENPEVLVDFLDEIDRKDSSLEERPTQLKPQRRQGTRKAMKDKHHVRDKDYRRKNYKRHNTYNSRHYHKRSRFSNEDNYDKPKEFDKRDRYDKKDNYNSEKNDKYYGEKHDNYRSEKKPDYHSEKTDKYFNEKKDNYYGDKKDNYYGDKKDNYYGDKKDNYYGDKKDNYYGDKKDNLYGDKKDKYHSVENFDKPKYKDDSYSMYGNKNKYDDKKRMNSRENLEKPKSSFKKDLRSRVDDYDYKDNKNNKKSVMTIDLSVSAENKHRFNGEIKDNLYGSKATTKDWLDNENRKPTERKPNERHDSKPSRMPSSLLEWGEAIVKPLKKVLNDGNLDSFTGKKRDKIKNDGSFEKSLNKKRDISADPVKLIVTTKNDLNWGSPVKYENIYKNNMEKLYESDYRPRKKHPGRMGGYSFGRTPIPFIGKRGIYAE